MAKARARGQAQFGDLPTDFCDPGASRVAILPVPYDGTSSYQKGADRGPAAIVAASAQVELHDIETDTEVYRVGIHTERPVDVRGNGERVITSIRDRVASALERGKYPVVLGGEHTVSLGAVQAARASVPGLGVLQLDAHTDLRAEYLGSPFNHACVMARIAEICPIVQVGIRSMDESEKRRLDPRRVFYAEGIAALAAAAERAGGHRSVHHRRRWMRRALSLLPPKVYVTIDLDVFDPSLLPSTGTPEPGGLGWYEVTSFLRLVATRREIVAFDVVELCPGENPASDFTAAKLVYKLLSYRFYGSEPRRPAGLAAPMDADLGGKA